jgi:hypothetical protein
MNKFQSNTFSQSDNLYKLLNSNFFIWFLSSVILSGAASLYHFSQQHYEQSQTVRKELTNCQFEIVNRLNHMSHLTRRSKTVADAQFALSSMDNSLGSVVPEFEHVNMAALYFKQYQLNGIQDSQKSQDFRELEEMHLTMLTSDPKLSLSSQDKNRILTLIQNLKNYESSLINKKT